MHTTKSLARQLEMQKKKESEHVEALIPPDANDVKIEE